MFDLSLLKAILTPEQRDFGLSVGEDEDALFLCFEGKPVVPFSSHGPNFEAIREEADRVMNERKSGIEFVKGV